MGKIRTEHRKNLIKKDEGLTQAHFEGASYSCLLETTRCHASEDAKFNVLYRICMTYFSNQIFAKINQR